MKEMGPIASDVQLIELPYIDEGDLNIRLKLTKGLWRLDYISLALLGEEVDPIRLQPYLVTTKNGVNTEALQDLTNPESFLVTYPRESFSLTYALPEPDQECPALDWHNKPHSGAGIRVKYDPDLQTPK